jgi:signal transduction histidine kinase
MPSFAISTQEDVMLEGVARQVADINQMFSRERLERAAAQDERLRLARELHDGVLQSLTGATLQLEALSRLIDEDPRAAQKRLRDIEGLVMEEQRELRNWIQKLHPAPVAAMASKGDLTEALETLCRRIERYWELQVRLTVSERAPVPRTLGDEIYRLVQEALSNIARHAHAEVGCVDVATFIDHVRIIVADDGYGFPFRGRYDLATLTAEKLGPMSLKERVTSLQGDLVLTSTASGSLVEIILPLHNHRAQPSMKYAARRA